MSAGIAVTRRFLGPPRDRLVMVANNADDPPFASLISTVELSRKKQVWWLERSAEVEQRRRAKASGTAYRRDGTSRYASVVRQQASHAPNKSNLERTAEIKRLL